MDGKFNSANLGTKELNSVDMWKCLAMLNFEKRDGRHPLALATNLDNDKVDEESEVFS